MSKTLCKILGESFDNHEGVFPHAKQKPNTNLCYAAVCMMVGNYYNVDKMVGHTQGSISVWFNTEDGEPVTLLESECKNENADPGNTESNWLVEHEIANFAHSSGQLFQRKTSRRKFLNMIKSEIDEYHPVVLRLNDCEAHYVCVIGYKKEGNEWTLIVSDPADVKKSMVQGKINEGTALTIKSPGHDDNADDRAIYGWYTSRPWQSNADTGEQKTKGGASTKNSTKNSTNRKRRRKGGSKNSTKRRSRRRSKRRSKRKPRKK